MNDESLYLLISRSKEIWRGSSMAAVIGSVFGALIFISDYPEGYRFVCCMAAFGGLLLVVLPVVFIFGFPFQLLIKLLSRRNDGVVFLSFAYGGAVGVAMSVLLLWWFDKDPVSLFFAGDKERFWFSLKAVLVAFCYFSALGLFVSLNMNSGSRRVISGED